MPLNRYSNVRVLDYLPHDEYLKVLKSADMVWGQFRHGDLGTTEIGAMALGKPVITSISVEAVGGDPPPVWSTSAPEQVVQYTLDILGNPGKYKDTVRKARSWVEKHYSVKAMAEEIERIYCEVTGTK